MINLGGGEPPNKLTKEKIEQIRCEYRKRGSIEKTASVVEVSPPTVSKYCSDLIRYGKDTAIFKIDFNTGKILKKYKNLATASDCAKISRSNICHCLSGRTRTAGGYVWVREKEYLEGADYIVHEKVYISKEREINNLLELGGYYNEKKRIKNRKGRKK